MSRERERHTTRRRRLETAAADGDEESQKKLERAKYVKTVCKQRVASNQASQAGGNQQASAATPPTQPLAQYLEQFRTARGHCNPYPYPYPYPNPNPDPNSNP